MLPHSAEGAHRDSATTQRNRKQIVLIHAHDYSFARSAFRSRQSRPYPATDGGCYTESPGPAHSFRGPDPTCTRSESKQARTLLEKLPTAEIIVPGNHDVSLHNVFERFLQPLETTDAISLSNWSHFPLMTRTVFVASTLRAPQPSRMVASM